MQWFDFMVIYMKRWQKEQLSGFVGVQTDLKSCRQENISFFFCKRLFKLIVVLMLLFGEVLLLQVLLFPVDQARLVVIWLIWYYPHEELNSLQCPSLASPMNTRIKTPRYWLAKAMRSSAALSDRSLCLLLLGSVLPACLYIDKGIAHEISGLVNP